MAVREDNRELFSTLSELVSDWGLDAVVASLIDVCNENSAGSVNDDKHAWEENASRLERVLDKLYPTDSEEP